MVHGPAPFRKEGAGHGQKHSGGTNRRHFFGRYTPDEWRLSERSFEVQARRYLGPRPALAE